MSLDFRQTIGANDPLRTGTYSKTLTFTLSHDEPVEPRGGRALGARPLLGAIIAA